MQQYHPPCILTTATLITAHDYYYHYRTTVIRTLQLQYSTTSILTDVLLDCCITLTITTDMHPYGHASLRTYYYRHCLLLLLDCCLLPPYDYDYYDYHHYSSDSVR